jgi:selenocysteine-specific elongation factor
MQALGVAAQRVPAVARVAVNLRGVDREQLARGDALITPDRFRLADLVDVRLTGEPVDRVARSVMLHIGSAAVPVRVRPLGADTARLQLERALPLHVGDRALLRDPGRRQVCGGVTVLDVAPAPLVRRGAATARAAVLSTMDGVPDEPGELHRRGLVRRGDLVRMGVPATGTPVAGEWLADPQLWAGLRHRLRDAVAAYALEHPLEPGAPVEVLRHALGLPDRALVTPLVEPPLAEREGRVGPAGPRTGLPEPIARAVERVLKDLDQAPFLAPDAGRLAELGLGSRELAAAVRAGALVRIADGVVLRPGAVDDAVRVLAGLAQPFTLSQARVALDSTRRIVVPLLELLDRTGAIRRLPDDRRVVLTPPGEPPGGPSGEPR